MTSDTPWKWDGHQYAIHSAHHRAYDDALVAPLVFARSWQVLEMGCGPGVLSARLAASVPDGQVTGVDASPDQIGVARNSYRDVPNLDFVCSDIQSFLSQSEPQRFDLCISQATLHWLRAETKPALYGAIVTALRPGGWFRFECGGLGQVADVSDLMDEIARRYGGRPHSWHFASDTEARTVLEAAGFDFTEGWVRLNPQLRPMDQASFEGFLDTQVLVAYLPSIPAQARTEFCAEAKAQALQKIRRPDGSYDQRFVRLDVLAQRL